MDYTAEYKILLNTLATNSWLLINQTYVICKTMIWNRNVVYADKRACELKIDIDELLYKRWIVQSAVHQI